MTRRTTSFITALVIVSAATNFGVGGLPGSRIRNGGDTAAAAVHALLFDPVPSSLARGRRYRMLLRRWRSSPGVILSSSSLSAKQRRRGLGEHWRVSRSATTGNDSDSDASAGTGVPSSRRGRLDSESARLEEGGGVSFSPVLKMLPATRTTTNPVDVGLSLLLSDVGSIGLGLMGLVLLLVTRVFVEDPYASSAAPDDAAAAVVATMQTRSNLLAVLACGTVLAHGVARLNVESALAEAVALEGVQVLDPLVLSAQEEWGAARDHDDDNDYNLVALKRLGSLSCWFLQTMLAATPASSAVLLVDDTTTTSRPSRQGKDLPTYNNSNINIESLSEPTFSNKWRAVSAAGILPSAHLSELKVPHYAPILDRTAAAQNRSGGGRGGGDETYLPTLQALPGRTEFLTYLPVNTQAVLVIPVTVLAASSKDGEMQERRRMAGVVVLGSNRARSFTPRDIVWCQSLASRLGTASARLGHFS